MTKKSNGKSERAVVVTTEHRGVFFGYTGDKADGNVVTLKRARLCLRWSDELKGFMGLAATGPTKNCRIGPAAPEITLKKVTSVMNASPEAVEAWEKGFWS
jgi:hypothetical protein